MRLYLSYTRATCVRVFQFLSLHESIENKSGNTIKKYEYYLASTCKLTSRIFLFTIFIILYKIFLRFFYSFCFKFSFSILEKIHYLGFFTVTRIPRGLYLPQIQSLTGKKNSFPLYRIAQLNKIFFWHEILSLILLA